MALSDNVQIPVLYGDRGHVPAAAEHIYEGAALEWDGSGHVQKCTANGNTFAGHAVEEVDNSGGSAGDKEVEIRRGKGGNGYLMEVTVDGGVSAGDEGTTVYASADDTYTKTSGTTNCKVGTIYHVTDASNNKAIVRFEPLVA